MDSNTDTSPTAWGRLWMHHSRGQVIIILAFSMVAIIGVLGLATDLGYVFVGRRAMQNAADAGALAGARIVSQSTTAHPLSARTEVKTIVDKNEFGGASPKIDSCTYVDDHETALGTCDGTVPPHTTGVKVVVSETHSTFFMRAIPFAPKSASSSASSTAHVQVMSNPPGDGPFLVCGVGTDLVSGGNMDILTNSGGTWTVNPAAVNQTFEIHGPQVAQCNAQSSRFKGYANNTLNETKEVPDWFGYTTGDSAGNIQISVAGVDGCQAGKAALNCVAFLPIVVNNPPETDNSQRLWAVTVLPFYVTVNGSGNAHYGKLLGDYKVSWQSQIGWNPNNPVPIVIKLTK